MNRPTKKYLLIAQLCLGIGLTICLILIPHFLFARNEGGMSNYGIHLKTALPYSLGFILAAFYVIQAALVIQTKSVSLRWLRRLLLGYGVMLLLILLTTYGYKTNIYLKNTHIVVTIFTFWFELLAAIWLCKTFLRDKINICLLVLQGIGLVIGSLTFFGPLHLLFISELITIACFGIILIRSSGPAIPGKI